MKIYLAGPLGFSEAGADFHNNKIIPTLLKLGHTVLDPWKLSDQLQIAEVSKMSYGPQKRDRWSSLNLLIGENNREALDACEIVLAVLDGTDIDSGTAAEIGYAFARGKKILGYRGDFRHSADNDGAVVNLQVEYFIRQSGGDIVFKFDDIPKALELLIKL